MLTPDERDALNEVFRLRDDHEDLLAQMESLLPALNEVDIPLWVATMRRAMRLQTKIDASCARSRRLLAREDNHA